MAENGIQQETAFCTAGAPVCRGMFDSHAHYDDSRFDGCRGQILEELFSGGSVEYIVNAGTNGVTSLESVALSEKYAGIYAAVGIHPHDAEKVTGDGETLDGLRRLLKRGKCVAIGEIGLDFHYDFSERGIQLKWFRTQMELARETGFPVVVHDREAHGMCMDITREFKGVTGIYHSFSGSIEMAGELVKLGWYISFSGVITFKNASRLAEVVGSVPLDRILIETDCPYLAPHPMRGKLNHSGYLAYTAEAAARIKGVETGLICEITRENAKKIYGIG